MHAHNLTVRVLLSTWFTGYNKLETVEDSGVALFMASISIVTREFVVEW